MGSFSMTCSISGLCIDAGTPVRALLLTENPYGEGWDLRTPPIRAQYNDYGSIEKVHLRDNPIAKLWLRGLREDLVEMGTGRNQCHDVSTRKSMTFDELLNALQEGRVFVRQDAQHFWRRPHKRLFLSAESIERERLTPTFQKIEQLLEADPDLQVELGGQVTGSGLFCGKFVVDEPRPRAVRVRWVRSLSGNSNKKYLVEEETAHEVAQLGKAKQIAERAGFVGCVIASTASRHGSVELVIFAPPRHTLFHAGPEWHTGKKETPEGQDAPLRVALAMVREDVWRALCRFPQRDCVSLDCSNCGQQSCYHGKGRECPDKSINGRPFKRHKPGSQYAHGPVFPVDVPHRLVRRSYGEDVWYGLDVYKHVVHEAWAAVAESFREKTPAELKALARKNARERAKRRQQNDESATKADVAQFMATWRQREADKRAAMTPETRAAYDAAGEELRAEFEREKIEKQQNPVFGDYLIHNSCVDTYRPGAWILSHSVPGVISVGNHLSMLLADRKPVSRALLDSIAELAAITYALRQARLTWQPATHTGSQYPEWDVHLRHLRTLTRVVEGEIDKCNTADWCDVDGPPLRCAPLTLDEVPHEVG